MLVNAVGQTVTPLAALLTAPVLAHALGVEGRGEVAAALAPMMLAAAVATVGLPDALTYLVARYPETMRQGLRHSVLLVVSAGAASAVLITVLAPSLSAGSSQLANLMAIAAVAAVPTLVVATLRGAASGLNLWGSITAERLVSSILRVVLLVGLAIAGLLSPLSAIMVMAYAPLVGALAYTKMLRRPQPEMAAASLLRARTLLTYGGRVWIGAVAGYLLSRIDQVLMTPLAGTHELGLYAVAVQVSEVPLILTAAITGVMFTADARLQDNERLGSAARIAGLLTLVVALGLGLPMHAWLPWVFSDEFVGAAWVAVILLLAVVAGTPGSLAGAALSARGNPGLRSLSLVFACVVNIPLLVVLAPVLGAVGAAVATLAGNVIAAYGNVLFLWRRHGVSPKIFFGLRRHDVTVFLIQSRRLAARLVPTGAVQ